MGGYISRLFPLNEDYILLFNNHNNNCNMVSITEVYRSVCPPTPTQTEKDLPDLSGKTFIVTGGTAGIGLKSAEFLLGAGAKVYITGRGEEKLKKAIEDLEPFAKSKDLVDFLVIDYSDLETIRPGVEKFIQAEKELHGILHNAGVMTPPYGSKTKQGYELQLGVNNVGPHLLEKYLDPVITKTAATSPKDSVRIVWVSSSAQHAAPSNGGINWDDMNYEKKNPGGFTIYGQSKAINIYESILWKKHHSDSKVLSLALNPGNLKTELQRHLTGITARVINMMLYEAKYGAYTELYCLVSPDVTSENQASFYQPWGRPAHARGDILKAIESENGEKIWNWLEEQTAPYYTPF